MTINNESERNYRGKCLGWPVTSYGAELHIPCFIRYLLQRLKVRDLMTSARLTRFLDLDSKQYRISRLHCASLSKKGDTRQFRYNIEFNWF